MNSILDFGKDALLRCFDGIEVRAEALEGDVFLHYPTFRGLIAFVTQEDHRVYATEADARLLLGRLLKFNLTWGLLPIGFLAFTVPLSLLNYWLESRSIRKQVRRARREELAANAMRDHLGDRFK
ncbi:MAG: hypothetical protein KDA83_13345 [Planctomycetales bacterium]|nr:hypothetical protein [Planctomycetales bacterium]